MLRPLPQLRRRTRTRDMKRVLQVIILALLCLTLVFISKARLDLALTIVPEAADDGGSGETVDTLAPESSPTPTPEPSQPAA